jgi:hypothetical protein
VTCISWLRMSILGVMLYLFWIYIAPSLPTDNLMALMGHVLLLLLFALTDFSLVCLIWGGLRALYTNLTMSTSEREFQEKLRKEHNEYLAAKPYLDRIIGDDKH